MWTLTCHLKAQPIRSRVTQASSGCAVPANSTLSTRANDPYLLTADPCCLAIDTNCITTPCLRFVFKLSLVANVYYWLFVMHTSVINDDSQFHARLIFHIAFKFLIVLFLHCSILLHVSIYRCRVYGSFSWSMKSL